jgi:hypothetical protein
VCYSSLQTFSLIFLFRSERKTNKHQISLILIDLMIYKTSAMKPAYWYMSAMFVAIFIIYLTAVKYVRGIEVELTYHDYPSMTALLNNFSANHPDLAHLYSIGKSVQGLYFQY